MRAEIRPIISNREIAEGYHELLFEVDEDFRAEPGQFTTIRISASSTPLLRRPFAFASCADRRASIIYQRRGPGTELLAGKREGDELDIIAPLGNRWPLPSTEETAILVAGGIGMGPILFLATELQESGRPAQLYIGARTGDLLPEESFFGDLNPILATDDGSRGTRGTVADLIPKKFPAPPRFYACGPEPMMRAVHDIALELKAPCAVSMEQTMACGVGACMGCVIRLADGEEYARVCADGPIFESRELLWS